MTDQLPDRSTAALPGHGPACGEDACLTCYLEAERDRLQAENQRLREAIVDALADLTPGYAPYSLLSGAVDEDLAP